MREISWVAEDLLDSEEELCPVEFRLEWKEATTIRFTKYYYKTPGKKEKTRKTVNQKDESGTCIASSLYKIVWYSTDITIAGVHKSKVIGRPGN